MGIRQGEDVGEGSPQANSLVTLEKWPHLWRQSLVSAMQKNADAGFATSPSPAHLSSIFILYCPLNA